MSMICYSPTDLDKVNPQFVGIASKFAQKKRSRLEIQKEHLHHTLHLGMLNKLDRSLELELQMKSKLLADMEQARKRRKNDLLQKLRKQQLHRKMVQNLHDKAQTQRKNNHYRIKEALSQTLNSRIRSRQQVLSSRQQRQNKLQQLQNQKTIRHGTMYKMVKQGQAISKSTVNQFYKQKNSQSLHDYQRRIGKEKTMEKKMNQDIKKMLKKQQKWKQKLARKKLILDQIESQIQDLQFSQISLTPKEAQQVKGIKVTENEQKQPESSRQVSTAMNSSRYRIRDRPTKNFLNELVLTYIKDDSQKQ